MDEQNKDQDTGYRAEGEGTIPSPQERQAEDAAGQGTAGHTVTGEVSGPDTAAAAGQEQHLDHAPDSPKPQVQTSEKQQDAPEQQGQEAPWQQGQAPGPWQAPSPQGPQGQTPSSGQEPPWQQGQAPGPWQAPSPQGPQGQTPSNGQEPPWQQGQAPGPWQAPSPQGPQGPYPQGGSYPPPYRQDLPQRDLYGQGMPPQGPQRNFYDHNRQQQPKPPVNNMAVTSMVLGIASLLSCCCCFPIGFIISFALGMGGLALAIISKKGKPFSAFAVAGLVLSILGICGSLFIFGCYILTAHMMQDPEYSALFNEILRQYYED